MRKLAGVAALAAITFASVLFARARAGDQWSTKCE